MLSEGWEAASCPPDTHTDATALDGLTWLPARVPGTAAGALRDAGRWRPGDPSDLDLDAEDWWFRTSFDAAAGRSGRGGAPVPRRDRDRGGGLPERRAGAGERLDVRGSRARCRRAAERAQRAGDPLPCAGSIAARTTCAASPLAHASGLRRESAVLSHDAARPLPGIAPGPAAVGPWRAVRLERRRRIDVLELTLRPRLDGEDGVLSVRARLRSLDERSSSAVEVELSGPSGSHRDSSRSQRCTAPAATHGPDDAADDPGEDHVSARGELRVPDVARWWPHTHGEPALHDVRLVVHGDCGTTAVDAGRVGFRELAFGAGPGHDIEQDGLDLHVNGVRGVRPRGACGRRSTRSGWRPRTMSCARR